MEYETSYEERFWSKVAKSDGCWTWTGAHDTRGYGMFGWPTRGAHRASWVLANGPIPRGLHVLHHCDNPPCVRPDHLFVGTAQDNSDDYWAKNDGARLERGQMIKMRRVIYLSDEEWEEAKAQSHAAGETISAYLRSLLILAQERTPTVNAVLSRDPVLGTATAQAERDAILGKINRGKKP